MVAMGIALLAPLRPTLNSPLRDAKRHRPALHPPSPSPGRLGTGGGGSSGRTGRGLLHGHNSRWIEGEAVRKQESGDRKSAIRVNRLLAFSTATSRTQTREGTSRVLTQPSRGLTKNHI